MVGYIARLGAANEAGARLFAQPPRHLTPLLQYRKNRFFPGTQEADP